jgi:hypothetical protein
MVAEARLQATWHHLQGVTLNGYRHILRHTRLKNTASSSSLKPLQDVALAIASGSVPVQLFTATQTLH